MHLPRATVLARWGWRHRLALAGVAAVVAFLVLAGRFWHPYYGFTRWLQLDELDAAVAVRELRAQPVFVYPGENGYDGAAYVQIAFHPDLDSPELSTAIGNVPYRARRILGSAVAWLLAGGNPAYIANRYAALNVAVWLALALLLWRVLPVTDARGWVAWAGVMFSAGALHSVRLALTDLLGAALVTAALALAERGRGRAGLAALALSGLARETALIAVTGLWRGPWMAARPWALNAGRTVLVALPLLAWMGYVRWKAGPADQGLGNLALPVLGWVEKWGEVCRIYVREPNFRWLNTTTLFATIALTVQAAWLFRRPRLDQPWWRAGVTSAALMLLLGTAVWEGQPGAATRVLLPMSIAFAVLVVRERARWGWVAGGSLAVFSGVLALWHVPHHADELAAGRTRQGAYIIRLVDGWSGVERDARRAWAWAGTRGELMVQLPAAVRTEALVRLNMRALTARDVEIRDASGVRWRGHVGGKLTAVEFAARVPADGRLRLIFESNAPPVSEGAQSDARQLGFAVYDLRIE